jgi:hypothetical protein
MKAVKAPPEEHARAFGLEAIRAVRAGRWIRAKDCAVTAAHFARIVMERAALAASPPDQPPTNRRIEDEDADQ